MKQLIRVHLTKEEMQRAAHGGIEHRIDAIFKNQVPRSVQKYHEQHWWNTHITGALAEIAVSKLLDYEWQWEKNPVYDVGRYQVRSTENPAGRLLVNTHDDPTHNFIFCKVRDNRVLIEGWITGSEVIGNNLELFPNCYAIDTYRLYPITDLPEFPQALPDGVHWFTPPVKKLGGMS
jgi:hypothetical protein